MLSTQILQIIIYIMIALLYIAYYYQLYCRTKIAKLLLIFEVGYIAINTVFAIFGLYTRELLHYVSIMLPMFLTISLYLSKGLISKILFIILSSLVIVRAANNIALLFRF